MRDLRDLRDLHTNLIPVVGSRKYYGFHRNAKPIRKVIDPLSGRPTETRRLTTTTAEAGLWMLYLESKEVWKKLWK